MDLACAAAGMSGNNEERKADNTLTKIFKETVIGWFKQNKTTNLYEDGELPKEALDKKTNLTYTLTEAKIEHGRFGINLVNYEIDAALEDLESDEANWDDFEDIQDKIGFLNETEPSRVAERLPAFEAAFDAVILGDRSMDWVLELLRDL